jgi:NADH-quinone oxidoreductase subunit H
MDTIDWIIFLAKPAIVCFVLLNMVPIGVWMERRGSALMQNRAGPNRIGPLGLLQGIPDAVKALMKEDFIPAHVTKFYYVLGPLLALIPAYMTFAIIPWASDLDLGSRVIPMQVSNLNVGILYVLSITSLGVYGIIVSGWASNNKYSLMGALRSSSQMISYELSMGLALVAMIMIYGSVELPLMVESQMQPLVQLGPVSIPKYGIFVNPIAFLLFTTAVYAETNRLPFDLPEGESEIVAGYHLEFNSMKFALFMMGEYINMFVGAALITTLFFGGYDLLPGMAFVQGALSEAMALSEVGQRILLVALQTLSFFAKTLFWYWTYIWVRWTIPRFRYDQLMDLGWKIMLPLALANILVTGLLVFYKVI